MTPTGNISQPAGGDSSSIEGASLACELNPQLITDTCIGDHNDVDFTTSFPLPQRLPGIDYRYVRALDHYGHRSSCEIYFFTGCHKRR